MDPSGDSIDSVHLLVDVLGILLLQVLVVSEGITILIEYYLVLPPEMALLFDLFELILGNRRELLDGPITHYGSLHLEECLLLLFPLRWYFFIMLQVLFVLQSIPFLLFLDFDLLSQFLYLAEFLSCILFILFSLLELNQWGIVQPQTLCELLSIHFVNIKHLLVRCFEYEFHVGYQGSLGQVLQFGVLNASSLEAVSDRIQFLRVLVDFVYLDPLLLQYVYELALARVDEHQSPPFSSEPGSSSHPMDICLHILRNIGLDDPIHLGEIKSSRGNIGAK